MAEIRTFPLLKRLGAGGRTGAEVPLVRDQPLSKVNQTRAVPPM